MLTLKTNLIKQLPNILTLLRIVLTCFINFYILRHFGNLGVPITFSLLIFITDLFDGKIARFSGHASAFGAVFDVAADLFFIVTSYIVLLYLHITPLWFLFIILFKFIEFIFTSYFLKKHTSEKSIFIFDYLGRLAAVLFYIIPLLAYTSFQSSALIFFFITHIFIHIVAFMVFLSSASRLLSCARLLF
ncbi:MAG: CDP-alcohol phosphatidyltransferase family protein [Bacillota bacterium]|nr:CDP-alcohol phosphatidyltransferase family protein [Bacillota bacterium]